MISGGVPGPPDAHDGLHAEPFAALFRAPFLVRADLPLDASARWVSDAGGLLEGGTVLLDFGCGRVRAGLSALGDDG